MEECETESDVCQIDTISHTLTTAPHIVKGVLSYLSAKDISLCARYDKCYRFVRENIVVIGFRVRPKTSCRTATLDFFSIRLNLKSQCFCALS